MLRALFVFLSPKLFAHADPFTDKGSFVAVVGWHARLDLCDENRPGHGVVVHSRSAAVAAVDRKEGEYCGLHGGGVDYGEMARESGMKKEEVYIVRNVQEVC